MLLLLLLLLLQAEVYYGWDGDKDWSAPKFTVPDRMVAWVEYRNVTQGVYVCANGGNATHPGYCKCVVTEFACV